jgi:hypothetical protein
MTASTPGSARTVSPAGIRTPGTRRSGTWLSDDAHQLDPGKIKECQHTRRLGCLREAAFDVTKKSLDAGNPKPTSADQAVAFLAMRPTPMLNDLSVSYPQDRLAVDRHRFPRGGNVVKRRSGVGPLHGQFDTTSSPDPISRLTVKVMSGESRSALAATTAALHHGCRCRPTPDSRVQPRDCGSPRIRTRIRFRPMAVSTGSRY